MKKVKKKSKRNDKWSVMTVVTGFYQWVAHRVLMCVGAVRFMNIKGSEQKKLSNPFTNFSFLSLHRVSLIIYNP